MLEIKDVGFKIKDGKEKKSILNLCSVDVQTGERIAIMGRSGSGKTTLLKLIAGISAPTEGDIYVDDRAINQINEEARTNYRLKEIGYIFQESPMIDSKTVYENIKLPLYYRKIEEKEMNQKVDYWLKQLGIESLANDYPKNLSGGERQKACIARAMIGDPSIILADEPTGSLDEASQEEVLEILETFITKEKILILVTHDDHVSKFCDRTYDLKEGALVSR